MKKNELKIIIYNYVGYLEGLKNELNYTKQEKEIYISLLENLNKENYKEIYKNIDIICILISTLFDKSISSKVIDKLFNIVYSLKRIEDIWEEEAIEEKEYQINVKRFKSLISFFSQKYKELDEREREIKEKYAIDKLKYARKILSKLKYSQKITSNELDKFYNILSDFNISVEDSILAIEVIRKHNKSLKNKLEKSKFVCKTEIEMMLDTEVEEYQNIYIEDGTKKKEYDVIVGLYINLIDNVENTEEIKELVDKPSEEENPNAEKFEYIMKNLLNYYREQMIEIKEMIFDKDCCFDEELKREITLEFNNIKDKWKKIKYIYNTEKLKLDKISITDMELPTVNNLFYARTRNGNVYVEEDLTKISEENLLKVNILLNKLRTNTLNSNENKALIENKKFRGYNELRKDQIRIIYLHLGNNNYLIIGIGTKKADNDLLLYNKMIKRNTDYKIEDINVCLKDASVTTEKIKNYIKENQRKGSR